MSVKLGPIDNTEPLPGATALHMACMGDTGSTLEVISVRLGV